MAGCILRSLRFFWHPFSHTKIYNCHKWHLLKLWHLWHLWHIHHCTLTIAYRSIMGFKRNVGIQVWSKPSQISWKGCFMNKNWNIVILYFSFAYFRISLVYLMKLRESTKTCRKTLKLYIYNVFFIDDQHISFLEI